MRYGVRLIAGAGLALVVLSACTSGSSASKSTAPPSTASSSTSTPTPTPTTATPTPTPTPLSAFEQDPGVQAMRKFTYAAGRTVNTGHYTSDQLRATMTPFEGKYVKETFNEDVGTRYPGPLPIQPIGVTINNSTTRSIHGCLLANGWTLDPKTNKPAHKREVRPVTVQTIKQSGRWLVNEFYVDKKVSCRGVRVRSRTW